jgi:hypothetical protein
VDEVRRARFGNGWVRQGGAEWVSLVTARFTASSASWESKENIDAGTSGNWFYLATGGATQRTTELRSTLRVRPDLSEAKPPRLPF